MTEVKLVSEMVREYIDELNRRPGVMDPTERASLIEAAQAEADRRGPRADARHDGPA